MAAQENVTLIVTTCNLKEKGRTKCHQFWPLEKEPETPVEVANVKFYNEDLQKVGISVVNDGPQVNLTPNLFIRKFKLTDTCLGIKDRVVT